MRYNNDRMGVHGPSWLASICYAVWLGVTLLSSAATAQVSVAAWHNDLSRTGANTKETTLIVSNVNQNTFGKLFSMPVDGLIFVQPLYLPNLNIAGKVRNVLFVATAANSLYAFDALSEAQLWRKNFGTPPDAADLSTSTDIVGPVGIIGTPVIDPATDTLYLVDRTKNTDGSLHQILRAVDVISGSDKLGSHRRSRPRLRDSRSIHNSKSTSSPGPCQRICVYCLGFSWRQRQLPRLDHGL